MRSASTRPDATQAALGYLADHGATGECLWRRAPGHGHRRRGVDYLMPPGGTPLDATATSRVTQERADMTPR